MLDTVLAALHHLLIFALFGVLVAEIILARDGMRLTAMRALIRIDAVYGGLAVLTIIVGVCRAIWGAKGWDYYIHNLFFWLKMAAFLGVGLCSVPPTLTFIRWRREAGILDSYLPKPEEVSVVRKWLRAQVHLFVLIPVFAALMARLSGYIAF